jgi:hypothetical protein
MVGTLGRISEPLNCVCFYFIMDILACTGVSCTICCYLVQKNDYWIKTTFVHLGHNEMLGITEIYFVQGV